MAKNLDRFKSDLDKLIDKSHQLEYAMLHEIDQKGFEKQAREQLPANKVDDFLKGLPNFKTAYQAWYSESISLLRQILPDRVSNFIALYEKPKNRKEITYENYTVQDYMQGLTVTLGGRTVVESSAALPLYRQQQAILAATKSRFESSLFDIRQIVQADVLDSEVAASKELLKNKFFRAAGALAGVVLEKHLRQVCNDHDINITKKHPAISDLNELLKNNSVIDTPTWRHISMLADIRNLCVHNKEKEPKPEQVSDLIDGTDKILKTIS
ncbi:MAG: hypothetical protein JSR61_04115 [Proteobacteria bacterium]|nr:hypothetical protein [Pseudomonadota bacterium]